MGHICWFKRLLSLHENTVFAWKHYFFVALQVISFVEVWMRLWEQTYVLLRRLVSWFVRSDVCVSSHQRRIRPPAESKGPTDEHKVTRLSNRCSSQETLTHLGGVSDFSFHWLTSLFYVLFFFLWSRIFSFSRLVLWSFSAFFYTNWKHEGFKVAFLERIHIACSLSC